MPSPGVFSFGQEGATVSITAKCKDESDSMTLVYVKAELLEVEFERAHDTLQKKNILTDESTTHEVDGNLFNPPFRGWARAGNTTHNFPVAHSFDETPWLTVKINITPQGIPFRIEGDGLAGEGGALKWKKDNLTSAGTPQLIDRIVTVGTKRFAQSAGITKGSIKWKVIAKPCANSTNTLGVTPAPDASGEHEIFRVFAKPNSAPVGVAFEPAAPSVRRMRTVCGWAEGKATPLLAVEALHSAWTVNFGSELENDWKILDGASGDCDDHVTTFVQGCLMLGIPGWVRGIYATTDPACLDIQPKEITINVNGVDVVVVLNLYFATTQVVIGSNKDLETAGLNEYQAVGYVLGKYWNIVGGKQMQDNSCEMYNYLISTYFQTQYWVFSDLGIPFKLHSEELFPVPSIECTE